MSTTRFYGINVGNGTAQWFEPKDDITAHELAVITGLLTAITHYTYRYGHQYSEPAKADTFAQLPDRCKRHFVLAKIEPE